ncbi:MAG: beta-lactamase family protein [Fusicatenibacter sp.]|nr:beta-lactamase family protein [Fusicatenibacter sp.]
MAAKEQLTMAEMIWDLMNGKRGHIGKTDFIPQKEAYGPEKQKPYFPRATPESQGISSEALCQMIRELAQSRKNDLHHLLILRNGKVICECHFSPYRSGIWHASYSLCKSITGMAIGLLVFEGKLSLTENIYDIFEKKNGLLQRILRPNVTVEHLLTMTSGVQFNEMGAVSGNDWVGSFLGAPVKGTPGEEFEYNSMNSYMLSAIVTERTGVSMMEYLRPRLFEPLGIIRVFWECCPAGITKGGWGLFLCPEDAAKLGQMYLQNGVFEGKQVIPSEWIAMSTVRHSDPPERMGCYGYGYQVWMEERPGSFAFNGMLGQNVLGYPDTNMVIVTNAGSRELFQSCELLDVIRKYFGNGFTPATNSKENPEGYRRLLELCGKMEEIRTDGRRILRGGWKNHGCSRRIQDTVPVEYARKLDGRVYEMEDPHVGIFPLVMQVFHNNFSEGIRRAAFTWDQGRFFVTFTEGKTEHRIEVGLTGSRISELSVNGEPYLVGTTGTFAKDENQHLVLKLDMAFLEEAARRQVSIRFLDEGLTFEWNETPGKELILAGLNSLVDTMAGNYLLSALRDKGEDLIHLLMERTIEPVVYAHLHTAADDAAVAETEAESSGEEKEQKQSSTEE